MLRDSRRSRSTRRAKGPNEFQHAQTVCMADGRPAVLSFDDFVIQVDRIVFGSLFSLFGLHPMTGNVFKCWLCPNRTGSPHPYLQYTCIICMIARRTFRSEQLRKARARRMNPCVLDTHGATPKTPWAPQLAARMRQIPGCVDVNTDMQINAPQVMVDIDRDRARALGVTPEQIQDALYSAYGTREVSAIYALADQYSVIMEVEPQYQPEPLDPADCGDSGDLYRTGRTVRELHSRHHDSLRPALGGVRHASACPLPLAGEFFTASQGAVLALIRSTPRLTSWVRARYFASSGSPEGRGSQVVRQRSAKPLLVGSIPTRASNFLFAIRRESRLADIPARCGYLS